MRPDLIISATLSYDRLGVGQSDHPDGIQVVQINYEIAQSVAIASLLRSGQLGNGVPTFSTVVGVGHSYGSLLLAGVASVCPDAFDINILTGFAANTTSAVSSLGIPGFETTIANVAYPDRWSYGGDYVSTPSVSIDQKEFFHYPNYTEAALQLFTTTKGEYTLGQIQSLSIPYTLNRDGYSKPTMVITGENDAPFCEFYFPFFHSSSLPKAPKLVIFVNLPPLQAHQTVYPHHWATMRLRSIRPDRYSHLCPTTTLKST